MKTKLLLLFTFLLSAYSFAQTTVQYPQQSANYTTFVDGGGVFDNGATELGIWAKNNSKQVVAWRNFTQTGISGGIASTMSVGDSFTITVKATQAYGQIGVSLLSSPSATASWNDRFNNYAVQVNLNGPAYGAASYEPWEIVSTGATINASTISGSTTYSDFKFKFTLNSATEMNVDINNGTEFFNVTVNKQNITGYSIYLSDDWNGGSNADIYWKPTTEYSYATTLSTNEFEKNSISINCIENLINIEGLEYNQKFKLDVYDLGGKLVKQMDEKSSLNIQELAKSVYILKLKTENDEILTKKIVKN